MKQTIIFILIFQCWLCELEATRSRGNFGLLFFFKYYLKLNLCIPPTLNTFKNIRKHTLTTETAQTTEDVTPTEIT